MSFLRNAATLSPTHEIPFSQMIPTLDIYNSRKPLYPGAKVSAMEYNQRKAILLENPDERHFLTRWLSPEVAADKPAIVAAALRRYGVTPEVKFDFERFDTYRADLTVTGADKIVDFLYAMRRAQTDINAEKGWSGIVQAGRRMLSAGAEFMMRIPAAVEKAFDSRDFIGAWNYVFDGDPTTGDIRDVMSLLPYKTADRESSVGSVVSSKTSSFPISSALAAAILHAADDPARLGREAAQNDRLVLKALKNVLTHGKDKEPVRQAKVTLAYAADGEFYRTPRLKVSLEII